MPTEQNTDFIKFLENMRDTHISHITRILELSDLGVTLGAPRIEDIIEREQSAIDNIQKSIDWLKSQKEI